MKYKLLILLTTIVLITACEPENQLPVASSFAVPVMGDTATVFMLEGRNSTDNETPYFALKYRWDTNADGTWDTEYTPRTSHAARFSKPGFCKYRLEVADDDGGTSVTEDSVFILTENASLDTLTDPRDGQQYRTVKIAGNWWMAESLRYGAPIPHNSYPRNDESVEFIAFNDDAANAGYGGLYTWMEANYHPVLEPYKDICPPGWRIPSPDQWSALLKTYEQPFDMLYYFGNPSIENLGVAMKGYYRYGDPKNPLEGDFMDDRIAVRYWTSGFTGTDTTRYFTAIHLARDSWNFAGSFNRTEWIRHPILGYIVGVNTPEACCVRCIKEK
jgi:uncharacterized protein (TIGR02145 family)